MPRRDGLLVSDVLARLVAADRQPWSLLTGHRDLGEVAERLRRVNQLPELPDVCQLEAPAGRVPVVIAHGPGFVDAQTAVAENRDRVWVITPFRTAVRLVEANVVPDVIVLAERDTWPVTSSLEQWRTLPGDHTRRLSAATLVVDAFAPAEIVTRFSRAYSFDSGPGRGTPLPLHGSAVLVAAALALVLGHRRVGIAGVDLSPGTRLAGLLAGMGEAESVQWCDVASCLHRGAVLATSQQSLRAGSRASHRTFAAAVAARELNLLAGMLREVHDGLAYAPADARLARLVLRIRSQWRLNATVVAAVERAELRWVSMMWQLDALGIQPIDAACSTQTTARLVLAELAAALNQHLRDCRECLDGNLGVTGVAA